MSYTINLGAWNSVFAVPCSVVDRGLKLAGSVQLKVLLWVLRHAGEPFEAQDIASALGIDRADVGDAMLYWRENGLIAADGETLAPSAPETRETEVSKPPAAEPAAPAAPQPAIVKKAAEQPRRLLSRPQKPDSEFVAKRMAESQEVACLMQSAQQIFGRLLSGGDLATLLLIHDDFGLPCDVIAMLIQYAVKAGKSNMRYIEKAAIEWADNDINTHEKAEERLNLLAENQKAWHVVEQAIGMPRRTPSRKEEELAPVWVNRWKFGPDMIREAYDRTVDGTGKYQPSYMNKILERWHDSGITTSKQAADEEASRSETMRIKKGGEKQSGEQTDGKRTYSFDIDEYERTSVNDTKE